MYRCLRLSQKPKEDWRTDDLEFLLSKTDNDSWATRIMSFQKIHEVVFGEVDHNRETINEPTIIRAISALIAHL